MGIGPGVLTGRIAAEAERAARALLSSPTVASWLRRTVPGRSVPWGRTTPWGRTAPLVPTPAAIRIERARSRRQRDGLRSDQVAVTVWFGEGPALPGVGPSGGVGRTALRIGASLLGAAVLALAGTAAARLQERETVRVEGTPDVPRLGSGGQSTT